MPDMIPNFINPDYATPEQLTQLRQMASLLQAQSLQPTATSKYGALAQGLMGFAGPLQASRAAELQRQAIGQYGQQYGNAVNQMGNPYARQLLGQNSPPPAAPGVGAQAMSFTGATEPRGIRNNNPGNIEYGDFARSQGAVGSDGRFAIFPSAEAGQAAMDKLLQVYSNKGINTPAGIVNRWAPPSENDSTSYAATVAKGLGVSPNAPLNMQDPSIRSQVAEIMAGVETGRPQKFSQQQQMAQANTGAVDPRLLGAIEANPWATEGAKGMLRGTVEPKVGEDVYGRPTVTSPQAGVRGLPVTGATPGYRGPVTVGAEGQVSAPIPFPATGGGQGPGTNQRLQELYDVAKGFRQQGAGVGATADQIKSDVAQAYSTIPIIQTLAQMKDTMQAHGDKMIWGPTADWVNNLRRSIAQHAPGFLSKSDLEGIAAADDFDKLSAQLQTMVGRQAGATDMSLLQGIKSVPGSHNSREGAMALIEMLMQTVGLNGQFMAQNQHRIGQPGFDYLTAKNKFFEDNPIRNPLTGNPIRLELGRKQSGGGETKIINGKTYTKINGVWHEGM